MARRTTRRRLTWLGIALLLMLSGIFLLRVWQKSAAAEYRGFTSPDGEFRVVVYALPALLPMTPGHGGDAPGFVRLYSRAGRVLQERPVEMVQMIDHVEWEPDRVRIKLFAEWPLPRQ